MNGAFGFKRRVISTTSEWPMWTLIDRFDWRPLARADDLLAQTHGPAAPVRLRTDGHQRRRLLPAARGVPLRPGWRVRTCTQRVFAFLPPHPLLRKPRHRRLRCATRAIAATKDGMEGSHAVAVEEVTR